MKTSNDKIIDGSAFRNCITNNGFTDEFRQLLTEIDFESLPKIYQDFIVGLRYSERRIREYNEKYGDKK